ncbi:MAG: hypothetical protein WC637_01635 [Victivallales bacterium]|jgi:hypothetical protein
MKSHFSLVSTLCILVLSVVLAFASQPASAKNLAVDEFSQIQEDPNGTPIGYNWCWGATSKMVLDYYLYPQSIFDIVTYGLGSSTYDTWNYMWGSGNERRANVAVWEEIKIPRGLYTMFTLKKKTVTLSWNGISEIVDHFSNGDVQTQNFTRSLTADEIKKEIDDNDAPFFIRLGWYDPKTNKSRNCGHFIVCYGVNGDVLSIHDPWFGSYVGALAKMENGSGIDPNSNHKWTHTVTTSKMLDVLFLFDTTGSMGSTIASAKASALALLDNISAKFKNFRVAVANYRDYPVDPYGGDGDYVYFADQAFSKDKTSVQNAINGLSIGWGNDFEESVYSALYNGLSGTGLSDGTTAWRDNPAKRIIILIGDAPGHDPEPWAGGHSFWEVLSMALNPDKPISVHCLLIGSNISAGTSFNQIAGGSGGSVVNTSGGDAGAGLQAIVDSVADSPRFPKDQTTAIYPTFVFEPIGNAAMGAPSTATLIEIQKRNPKTLKYSLLRLVTLKDPTDTIWESTLPFPQGHYRWRLGFRHPATKLYLPSLGTSETSAASTVFEDVYTEFDRTANPPGNVTPVLPNSGIYAQTKVEYSFGAVPGATKYVIEIYADGKKWRTLTVMPPRTDPDASVLKVNVSGHRAGVFYTWRIQALNYDRPKADPNAWVNAN